MNLAVLNFKEKRAEAQLRYREKTDTPIRKNGAITNLSDLAEYQQSK